MDNLGTITVTVTGHPVAKGRARASIIPRRGGGYVSDGNGRPVIRHHTPEKTRRWESDARDQARAAMAGRAPYCGPLAVTVIAYFAPATSWPAWKRAAALSGEVAHTAKPDADNVLKAAKDALNGVVWLDDSQVAEAIAAKRYSDTPRVVITITPLPASPSSITNKSQMRKL